VDVDTNGRTFVHIDIEPTQIGRVFARTMVSSPTRMRASNCCSSRRNRKAKGQSRNRSKWPAECRESQRIMLRRADFDNIPLNPQRAYQEMNKAFGRETSGQAGPLGSTAALGMRVADPDRPIVALSGDYGFQFMIEELAVGAQFKLPYIHVLVNNSYVGWIRQSQHGFSMDYCAPLGFDNLHPPELQDHDMDRVKMAQGLGGDAIRVSLDLRRLNRLSHSPKQR
jgi:tartronate-semialdehyde synthase